MRHVLERMLAKELNVRYRDAESLEADIDRLLADPERLTPSTPRSTRLDL